MLYIESSLLLSGLYFASLLEREPEQAHIIVTDAAMTSDAMIFLLSLLFMGKLYLHAVYGDFNRII
jgi:hypothetical protein